MSRVRRKLIGDRYEKHGEIGRGTYGTVYEGVELATKRRIAIKKVVGKAEAGEAEAALLRRCQGAHHVIQLLDVVNQNGKIYLILEYMDSDLETIIKATEEISELSIAHVKTHLQMLLRGVHELHSRNILHRDLKPNNLLFSKDGRVAKISDFGMATYVDPAESDRSRSLQVITRAYRPPELFFGQDRYDFSVDMWSVGCIFAEMLLRRAFFDGASDIDQLSQIFHALGSPDENNWKEAADLPFYLKFHATNPKSLKEQFPQLSTAGINLLSRLLALDPSKRITASDALKHPFFSEEPRPAASAELELADPPERAKKRPIEEVSCEAVEDGGMDSGFVLKGRRIM
ncbi:hypothetical protein P43SY_004591 [Pythium insidiosum]|uniref:Cyclin-dependent kinase 2 homolog n=1 Tax=Pythium insidiosum TaxID=114742 RepID=A0AAD5LIH7_PYTIN|nr:hypothetical protein P43SY_004591 [Pythium insidiosum]